jgi:tetratricopeptide (TPR) repeat protein
MSQIVILFKGVGLAQLADPGPQLRRVLRFRRKIENEKHYLYHHFDEIDEFSRLLRRFLSKWTPDREDDQSKTSREASDLIYESASQSTSSSLDTEISLATEVVSSRSPESLRRYGAYLESVERYYQSGLAAALSERSLREQQQQKSRLASEIRAIRTMLISSDSETHPSNVGEDHLHIHAFLTTLGEGRREDSFSRGPRFDTTVNLGQEYCFLGARLTSIGLLQLAQETQVRGLGWARSTKSPDATIAAYLNDLSVNNCLSERYTLAEALARQAISTISGLGIAEDPRSFTLETADHAILIHTLAVAVAYRHDHGLARDLFELAQSYWGEIFGSGIGLYRPQSAAEYDVEARGRGDSFWAASHAGIGVNYLLEGELALAEKFHIECQLRVGYIGPAAPAIAHNLGVIYHLTDRRKEAEESYRVSLNGNKGDLLLRAGTLRNLVALRHKAIPYEAVASSDLDGLLQDFTRLRSTVDPSITG